MGVVLLDFEEAAGQVPEIIENALVSSEARRIFSFRQIANALIYERGSHLSV